MQEVLPDDWEVRLKGWGRWSEWMTPGQEKMGQNGVRLGREGVSRNRKDPP